MAKKAITVSRTIQATPEVVFRALTNATALGEWFCDLALFDKTEGGNFYVAWNSGYYATGQITKLDAPRKLGLTWQGRGEPAVSAVKLTVAQKKAGTMVTVTHSDVGTGKKWGDAPKEITRGWERGLENLQSVLETGEDRRFTMRPMLGVSGLSEVTPEMVERLKLPVKRGVQIDGTAEGMGARAAGLQKDDVLVTMDKHKIWNYPSILGVLAEHQAGDTVEVAYYRDGAKRKTKMTLTKRPLPPIPATAAELAEALRANYTAGDAELDKVLAGVSEAEADFRPAPDEWNVKEVVAHLLLGERDTHPYLVEWIASDERPAPGYQGNSHLRTRATAQVYGTLAALVEELQRHEAETVAIAAGLPEAFVAEKRTYWRMAYALLQNAAHITQHAEQISAAVGAARHRADRGVPAPTDHPVPVGEAAGEAAENGS
jgi:uncharacterized protein YndB with AHSA1/START domain